MDSNVIRLLEGASLLMEYLSFWLVAPELLGEERIKQFEQKTEAALEVFLNTWEARLSPKALYRATPLSRRLVVITLIFGIVAIVISLRSEATQEYLPFMVVLTILVAGSPIVLVIVTFLLIFGSRAWLRFLTGRDLLRWRLLQIGALTFTVAAIIKFILLFQTPDSPS
jgi:hypothetical protein